MVFVGIEVDRIHKVFITQQAKYTLKLNQLPSDATFNLFLYNRRPLAWLTNDKPDMVSGVNILIQVTEEQLDETHAKQAEKILKHLQSLSRL